MENNLKKTKDSLSIQINKRVVIENDWYRGLGGAQSMQYTSKINIFQTKVEFSSGWVASLKKVWINTLESVNQNELIELQIVFNNYLVITYFGDKHDDTIQSLCKQY